MPHIKEEQTFFHVDGTRSYLVPVPDGTSVTVQISDADVFYGDAETVTQNDNDGKLKKDDSKTFTSPVFLTTAQGESARVFQKTHEALVVAGDKRADVAVAGGPAKASGTKKTDRERVDSRKR